jgi:dihydrofolate reductase
MQLSLIVAYALNRVIGRDNTLPWKLPSDLAHFKRTTLGHPVIMGRKTWESLGRPLPGRRNIVISRNPQYEAAGAQCVTSLALAIEAVQDAEQAFVIGGAQIYQEALPFAQSVIATEILDNIEGDAFFAPLDKQAWSETSRTHYPPENGLSFDVVQYAKIGDQGIVKK